MLFRRALNVISRVAITAALFVLALGSRPATIRGEDWPVRTGILGIHIESDKTTYVLGEPITIRLTIRNNSDDPYAALAPPPWGACILSVTNGKGEELSSVGRQGYRSRMADVWELPPGKTVVAKYVDWKDSQTIREWADIRTWGYDVTEPGEYTIVAAPTIEFFARTATPPTNAFYTSRADTSNTLHISVVKP